MNSAPSDRKGFRKPRKSKERSEKTKQCINAGRPYECDDLCWYIKTNMCKGMSKEDQNKGRRTLRIKPKKDE